MTASDVPEPNPATAFYSDLAPWWPLLSPVDEYDEEAAFAATLLRAAERGVHDVLELGSGGGHNAFHLKDQFDLTLVDLSEPMLEVSRGINPECRHVRGDMRELRLGTDFDAVFVHDAVAYMTTEADLARAVETALVHCRPGGVAVFVPDEVSETFEPATEHGGSDGDDGRAARYLAWTSAPAPDATTVVTEYAFLLRDADGTTHVVHDTHHTGLFGRDTWLRLLVEAGFEAYVVAEQTTEDRTPRQVFVGRRPA